jgi:hypothetical protein
MFAVMCGMVLVVQENGAGSKSVVGDGGQNSLLFLALCPLDDHRVLPIINSISQTITKQAECSLSRIGDSLLFRLLDCLAFDSVLANTEANVLVACAILESDSHDSCNSNSKLSLNFINLVFW